MPSSAMSTGWPAKSAPWTAGIVIPIAVSPAVLTNSGNDAPVMWMAYQRGVDLHSLRKRETETERENRLLREENDALRRVLMGRVANA